MKFFIKMGASVLLAAATLPGAMAAAGPATLVVHEWGTFTSCEEANGHALGGINTDDEPVPPFVHDLVPGLINALGKGIPAGKPSVTMRLETPVLYFYPSPGAPKQLVNVLVRFRGGWLSQYYPDAVAVAPGVSVGKNGVVHIGPLTASTVGSLRWTGVRVGVAPGGPKTLDNVWTAPRKVKAAYVEAGDGEVERFLFYRGVGHVRAPLRVVRHGSELAIHMQRLAPGEPAVTTVDQIWLTEFRSDGRCAFTTLENVHASARTGVFAIMRDNFSKADFSRAKLAALKRSMHHRLVSEGLFSDEATAMLNTWQQSYFKSGGERLFFIVPPAWTNYYLPLRISSHPAVTRVMMGRIELVTPRQSAALKNLFSTRWNQLHMKKAIGDYRSLGRFAYALIAWEQRRVHHGIMVDAPAPSAK